MPFQTFYNALIAGNFLIHYYFKKKVAKSVSFTSEFKQWEFHLNSTTIFVWKEGLRNMLTANSWFPCYYTSYRIMFCSEVKFLVNPFFLTFSGFVSQSFCCTCGCLKAILNFESMYIQLLVKSLLWELDEFWQNDTSYMYCYFEHWANTERWCSTFIELNNFEERQIFLAGKKTHSPNV